MLKPVYFENDQVFIHPFRPEDLGRFEQISQDLLSILSDEHTLKFLPGKRLRSLQEAEWLLQSIILNFHSDRNYVYFISHKKTNRVIGVIDLVSPKVAREHYQMDDYPFFIEFYLAEKASGSNIMKEILPAVVNSILSQGIERIGAVVNRHNIAAKKVLSSARFMYKAEFDVFQDLYETA